MVSIDDQGTCHANANRSCCYQQLHHGAPAISEASEIRIMICLIPCPSASNCVIHVMRDPSFHVMINT